VSPHPAEGPAGTDLDKAGQAEIEGRSTATPTGAKEAPKRTMPAGPHAEPTLTSPDATPGAGALPSASPDDEADAATG
jgi:hypothetical protein